MDNHKLRYLSLNLFSNKLNVKIIGGGKAATIKAATFCKQGANVTILAKDFTNEILELKKYGATFIHGEYNKDFIKDGHIILIAIDDALVYKTICNHCIEMAKIYIDCTNFKLGMGVVPSTRELDNLTFSISTKVGAPMLSKLLADMVQNELRPYDEFTLWVSRVREKAKINEKKSDIIKFICTNEFKEFYDKGKQDIILEMYFGKEFVSTILNCNNTK